MLPRLALNLRSFCPQALQRWDYGLDNPIMPTCLGSTKTIRKTMICLFQELRKALQHLQGELHSKSQQLHVLEAEKYNEIRTQGQNIQHLSHSLSHKEQLIQVSPQMKVGFSKLKCRSDHLRASCAHESLLELEAHSE